MTKPTTAGGVDHSDETLANARPRALAAFAGTAIGGVAWGPNDVLPPALTGSSVAAAVLSAVSAWVHRGQLLRRLRVLFAGLRHLDGHVPL